jgi:chromate transporter
MSDTKPLNPPEIEQIDVENDQKAAVPLLIGKTGLQKWFTLFWLFIKVNTLTTSGPASVGLLYKEAVGNFMTESEFVEAVGFSSVVPGSEAIKLAMFVGYAAGGVSGAIAAILGAVLPPTLMMLVVVSILQRIHNEALVNRFVNGLVPAVAVLILMVAWDIFIGEGNRVKWPPLIIVLISLIALVLNAPAPLVLVGAGILGIILFR